MTNGESVGDCPLSRCEAHLEFQGRLEAPKLVNVGAEDNLIKVAFAPSYVED